jgi:hypothetical protein
MGFLNRLFGTNPPAEPDPDTPFMEHPTGDFESAVDAMTDAIRRLRALPNWDQWITFCAQGMGHDADSEHHAEIRLRNDELRLDEPIDLSSIAQQAGVPPTALTANGATYSLKQASPAEAARVLDAIFRHHLGIRPFPDEADDYAVGAEW